MTDSLADHRCIEARGSRLHYTCVDATLAAERGIGGLKLDAHDYSVMK